MKTSEKKMRLGRVAINTGYIVDLDNEEMVQHAKDSLYEDIYNAIVKSNEIFNYIVIEQNMDAKEEDIPSFLLDEDDEDWEG